MDKREKYPTNFDIWKFPSHKDKHGVHGNGGKTHKGAILFCSGTGNNKRNQTRLANLNGIITSATKVYGEYS